MSASDRAQSGYPAQAPGYVNPQVKKAKKVRLDDLLFDLGYFPDRAGALRAVLAHTVRVDDVYPTSAAIKVSSDADILVKGAKRYVSRGGFKLQGGIDAFGVDVHDAPLHNLVLILKDAVKSGARNTSLLAYF